MKDSLIQELEHQLKDSGAEAIVIFANSAHILEKVLTNTSLKHVIVTEIGDMLKFPKNLIVNFVLKKVKKMVPNYSLPSALNLKNILATANYQSFKKVEITHDDIAFLQYTSGSTAAYPRFGLHARRKPCTFLLMAERKFGGLLLIDIASR